MALSAEALGFVIAWGAVAFLRAPELERCPARSALRLALASAAGGVAAALLATAFPNLLDVSRIYVLIGGLLVFVAWGLARPFLGEGERAALFTSGLPFGFVIIPDLFSYSGLALWRFLGLAAFMTFAVAWAMGSLRREIRLRRVAAAWAGVPAELVALAVLALAASRLL